MIILCNAYSYSKHFIGASFIRLGIDGIPNALTLYNDDGTIDYTNVTEFSAADYAFLLTYATLPIEGLSVGGNTKIIHRKVGPFAKSWGLGLDLNYSIQIKQNISLEYC